MNHREEVSVRLYFIPCYVSLSSSPKQRLNISFSIILRSIFLETTITLSATVKRTSKIFLIPVNYSSRIFLHMNHILHVDILQLESDRIFRFKNCLAVHYFKYNYKTKLIICLSLPHNFSQIFLGSSLKTILSVKIPNRVFNCKCNINLKGSNTIITISLSLCQLSICQGTT